MKGRKREVARVDHDVGGGTDKGCGEGVAGVLTNDFSAV
jgi:hypothetical protein